MTISKVTKVDISAIFALQNQMLISNTDMENGFLVSAFSQEDYLYFCETYDFFYKAVIDDKLVGVVMAFHSKHIKPEDKNNSLLRDTVIGDCIVIKQIFVAPDVLGKGVSSRLYDYLFEQIGDKLPIVCIIVIEPFNERSCRFHTKHKFIEYLHFIPDNDKDGILRKRSAWVRLPCWANNLRDSVRLTNIYFTDDDDGEVMASRADAFVSLYLHEDNLNWTKFGMQTTILFALFASFAFFYEKPLAYTNIPILGILGIWGIIINYLFLIKIKSGLNYMNTYKNKIKEYDKLLMFYYPKVMPIFAKHEKIAKISITSRLLYCTSLIGLVSWCTLATLLILKAMNICIFY